MKAFSTLFSALLLAISLHAQAPVNDDCSGLIDLGVVPFCSSPAQYTNVNATPSVIDVPSANIPACFNNGVDRDVWFKFTIPADGSIVDVEISIFGDIGGNGTLKMPQVAIYRGDCTFGELAELDCAAAAVNVNELHLQQFGLTPGLPYFLRINDYSATGTPNAGAFKLCVEKYVPEINMGDATNTGSCTGTLWDSGGPTADYGLGEDLSFTICPQDFHQCIILNVEEYDIESGFDFLLFYQGNDVNDLLLTQIAGTGNNFEVQIPAPCATIRFTSDGFAEYEGFKITWTCSPSPCTTAPPTTCSDPDVIAALPYAENGLSNCFSGNTIDNSPCDDNTFLQGNDYIFSYTSPGNECINISTNGTNIGAGLGVYDQCPTLPGANCISSAGGGFASVNPVVSAAFLENPGTYYIVFGAGLDCSQFDITVDTITCPVVLPSAATCDNALNIGGCSNILPEIISLNPGAGDPNFIVDGLNQGCFVFPQQNYSFFYFTAGADGKFGFSVQAADPDEASDIDFNVWGPIPDAASICDYVSNNQPIRSSWAAGADPTGLADIHPVFGNVVDDEFDCGSPATPGTDPPPPPFIAADDFVKRIDVLQGEIYVILLDDYGNTIVQGGISIDFSGATDGVLDVTGDPIAVSPDTAVCIGQPVQLNASGGLAYFWAPPATLSCTQCPDPIANPSQTTTYQVQIATACNVATRIVNVKAIEIKLGPDVTVCNNASFTLNENGYQGGDYTWTGPAGLSCYDCPSPIVSGLTTGVYNFVATVFTPQCTIKDTIKITVVSGQQPQYNISQDKILCAGQTVNLGGAGFPNTFYQWSSVPSGFIASGSNPPATPLETTTYYLVAVNTSCPYPSTDSVLMTVYQAPVLAVQGDTAICNGQSVLLGTTATEAGITYTWTPDNGTLDSTTLANPLATPLQTTIYQLTATNPGCVVNETVQVTVINFELTLDVADSLRICKGTSVPIQATLTPAGGVVSWSPLAGLQLTPNGLNATASPEEPTLYTASAAVPGCVRKETVFIRVDSIPLDLAIHPSDTSICQGAQVLLTSTVYEPAEYPIINFQWSPGNGQLTPDSLYNMVVQPDTTTLYKRITISGACVDTAEANVTVIQPAEMRVEPADTTICEGQSIPLKVIYSPGVTNIMWSPTSGLSCTDCDNPTATPPGTTTYTVMGEFMGCPASASATVNVRNLPLLQFPGDTQLCGGESVTLNQAFDPTATYNWTSTDPNFMPTNNPQPTVTQTIPVATYFVTASNGCSNSGQVTINVTSATLAVDGDTTVCQSFPALLTASGTLPGTYTWSSGQTGQAVVVTPGVTTTYTVVYNYGDGCTLSDQVTVNVQGVGPEVAFPNDTELCPGDSLNLNSIATPGATYSWTSTPAGFTFNGAIPPPQSPGQSTQYNVTATLGNCTVTKSVNVIVYNATLTVSEDQNLCAGETATLTANGSLTGEYLWSTSQNTASIDVSPSQTTTYDVLYTYGQGCTLEDAVKVTVVSNFVLSIATDPDTNVINVGDPLELMAVVAPSQNLSNFQFQWLENGTVNVGNTETVEITPSTADSTIFYKLIATSPAGCMQMAQVSFHLVQPLVVVPNAFTPNDDGVNDQFRLKVLEGSVTILEMNIYNRWGTKVYGSTDPNAAWDGKMDNGKEAPSDIYVYYIRWQRGDGALQPPKKGDIALLR